MVGRKAYLSTANEVGQGSSHGTLKISEKLHLKIISS